MSIVKGNPGKEQRRLAAIVLALTTAIFVYLFVGVAFYSHLEGWDVVSGLYFMVVTLLAVGYGDLHPSTDLSRVFTMIYSLVGMSLVFFILKNIFNYLIDLRDETRLIRAKYNLARHTMHLQTAIGDSLAVSKDSSERPGRLRKISSIVLITSSSLPGSAAMSRWRRNLFQQYPRTCNLTVTFLLLVSFICVNALLVNALNVVEPKQDFFGAMYFTVITGLTIGYGDIYPRKHARLLMAVWIPLQVVAMSRLLIKLDSDFNVENGDDDDSDDDAEADWSSQMPSNQKAEDALRNFVERCASGQGDLNEAEYMRFMLLECGIVSKDILQDLSDRFVEMGQYLGDGTRSNFSKEKLRASIEETSQRSVGAPATEIEMHKTPTGPLIASQTHV